MNRACPSDQRDILRPIQIKPIPTTARIAPRVAQVASSIMKLDAGQRTKPAPCPIHSSPISKARIPMIVSKGFSIAMAFPLQALVRRFVGKRLAWPPCFG
jgi:hypothetical protein